MACNESLDFQQAISHALQRIQYGLILDASLSWLAFLFTKQCYSLVAITKRGSTKAAN